MGFSRRLVALSWKLLDFCLTFSFLFKFAGLFVASVLNYMVEKGILLIKFYFHLRCLLSVSLIHSDNLGINGYH